MKKASSKNIFTKPAKGAKDTKRFSKATKPKGKK